MNIRELMHRLPPNAQNSRYFSLGISNSEKTVSYGIAVERTSGKGTLGIFRPHNVFFVRQILTETGKQHLIPKIVSTLVIGNGEFFSARDAKRWGTKKAKDMIPGKEELIEA